jgi:hypothetical protein
MKKAINAGLALASHNNSVVNSTLFDNVSVTPADPAGSGTP